MNRDTDKPVKSYCRRFRFRLRTLLLIVMVLAIPLGWAGWELNQVRQEKDAIVWISEMGGRFKSTHRYQYGKTWSEKLKDYLFGESVRTVSLSAHALNSGKSYNSKIDLSLLKELRNLRELLIYNYEVDGLAALAELNNLDYLILEGTSVQDISPLSEMTKLEVLSLSKSQVTDLSPLANLKKLEKLHLADTQIDDVAPLAELDSLEYLSLMGTQVSDLSPLWNLKNLEIISIIYTPVSGEEKEKFKQALPECGVF